MCAVVGKMSEWRELEILLLAEELSREKRRRRTFFFSFSFFLVSQRQHFSPRFVFALPRLLVRLLRGFLALNSKEPSHAAFENRKKKRKIQKLHLNGFDQNKKAQVFHSCPSSHFYYFLKWPK